MKTGNNSGYWKAFSKLHIAREKKLGAIRVAVRDLKKHPDKLAELLLQASSIINQAVRADLRIKRYFSGLIRKSGERNCVLIAGDYVDPGKKTGPASRKVFWGLYLLRKKGVYRLRLLIVNKLSKELEIDDVSGLSSNANVNALLVEALLKITGSKWSLFELFFNKFDLRIKV
jgi:hypothetical protein